MARHSSAPFVYCSTVGNFGCLYFPFISHSIVAFKHCNGSAMYCMISTAIGTQVQCTMMLRQVCSCPYSSFVVAHTPVLLSPIHQFCCCQCSSSVYVDVWRTSIDGNHNKFVGLPADAPDKSSMNEHPRTCKTVNGQARLRSGSGPRKEPFRSNVT